jgi:hypothetical protein
MAPIDEDNSNLVTARVRWVSSLAGENLCYGVRYLYEFLDRIIESKDSNDFLVQLRLYLAKIWKKSKRGRNLFQLRHETWFPAGLVGVKAKTLSGVKSGSWLGLVRVRQVKAYSLSGGGRVSRVRLAGLSGLAGLSWGRVKPLTRIGLSLISGWVS